MAVSKRLKPTPFNNTYVKLGEDFYAGTSPAPVSNPELIIFNHALGDELGLADTYLAAHDSAAIYAGNVVPKGAEPVAMAYSGHQFGHFNPQLGDGRALLLGQIESPDGTLRDIHLKGTGQTRYSRNGDGRAALGPRRPPTLPPGAHQHRRQRRRHDRRIARRPARHEASLRRGDLSAPGGRCAAARDRRDRRALAAAPARTGGRELGAGAHSAGEDSLEDVGVDHHPVDPTFESDRAHRRART